MASVINTNMASLYAQKNLSGAQNALSTSVERLSSGLRINRAKDDAAGLGISEKIKSQVTSLNQGLRNANDAISMVQTAEGSLSEVSTILQRMKELSVQARNESLSTTQRSFISDELVALKNEINAIAERTTFNDLSLLKNALRTDVVTSGNAAGNKLVDGATVLAGVNVSDLKLSNTANVGTYSLTSGSAQVLTKQSTIDGVFNNGTVDKVTLTGTYQAGDSISVSVIVNGGSTATASYTVTLADNSLASIATNVSNALATSARALSGDTFAVSSSGAVISIAGDTPGVGVNTSVTTSDRDRTTATATHTVTTVAGASTAQTSTFTLSGDYAVGDQITVTSGGGTSNTTVTYTVTSSDDSLASIATNLASALNTVGQNLGTAGDQWTATASSGTVSLVMDVANNARTFAESVTAAADATEGYSITTSALVDAQRTVTIAAADIQEGAKFTLTVGGKDYSVVAGSGAQATVAGEIATNLEALLAVDYPTETAVQNTNEILFDTGAGVGLDDIKLTVTRLTAGDRVENVASYVSDVSAVSVAADRTIQINDYDLAQGRLAVVRVGNPEITSEYKVWVDGDDTTATLATKLGALLDDNFGSGAAAVSVNTSTSTIVFDDSLNLGQSVITLDFFEGVETGPTAVKASSVTSPHLAESLRKITVNAADAQVGNVLSVSINGKEYAVKVESSEASSADRIAQRLANLIQMDYPNTDSTTATADFPAATRVSVASNVISLTADAKLGLADISMTVKTIADPGKFTLTANADTGIGGTSQTVDIGSIAAGGAKVLNFDNLGVSFQLNNANNFAVDNSSFAAFSSKVNLLEVGASSDGEALFQVGAGTRDTVVINGFKDIRITGYNNNADANEKLVFDSINTTLNNIAQNTTASLSEANFATLENQIEAAITTVSDFRSYLGAQQNRIEFAISNIQAQSENLTAANSRIVDTDYAAETANLTKTQIMQQAATAMLAQANQMPNVILALLK